MDAPKRIHQRPTKRWQRLWNWVRTELDELSQPEFTLSQVPERSNLDREHSF